MRYDNQAFTTRRGVGLIYQIVECQNHWRTSVSKLFIVSFGIYIFDGPACLWRTRQWCGSQDGYSVSFILLFGKNDTPPQEFVDIWLMVFPCFKSSDIFPSMNSKDVRRPGYTQRHLVTPKFVPLELLYKRTTSLGF